MGKYTVTFTVMMNDNTKAKDTYVYTSKKRAREAYEKLALILIEKYRNKEIKDFQIVRSRNTGR